METASVEKEATILALSKQLGDLIDKTQSLLDDHFARNPVTDSGKAEGAAQPNVLDEILEQLKQNRMRLQCITSFLQNDILPKIS